MLFILFVVFILIGLSISNPRILDFVVIIYMAILTYVSTNVPDFISYQGLYYDIMNPNLRSQVGIGWYYISFMGHQFNLTYAGVKCVLVLLGLLLLRSTEKYFLKDTHNYIWALYLLYPALADAVQIRFFAATSIVVFALRFLSLDTFVGYASYTLFVLIAGQIHSSAYFYILFLAYIFLKPLQKAMRWMWPFILVGSFFLKKFIVSLTLIFASSRQSTYIYNPPREYASTFPAYASMLVIFYFVSKAINDEVIIRNNITEKEKQFSKLFYCICIISFVLLPLIEMEWDFSRLLRPMWFLLYIDGIIAARNNLEIRLGPVKVKNIKLGIVCLSLIFGFLLDLCHFSASVLQAFFFYK